MKKTTSLYLFVLLIAAGCATSKTATEQATSKPQDTTSTTDSELQDETKAGEKGDSQIEKYRYHYFDGYQAERTRHFDLLHTELHVSFDWEKEHLLGNARLTLTPWFYPQDELVLDAKYYDIHEVALVQNEEQQVRLHYTYDTLQLTIELPRKYEKGEELDIMIRYTAKPNESKSKGGQAITGDQGLYFVNADGSNEDKPRQLWTQGEPEANSHWFPTIDAPNERTTQDIHITVNDSLTTLSNGALVSEQRNDDGTRTDHWRMEQSHAPYLFMMAVGNFEVVEDEWEGIPVNYYMEPRYAPYAKDIFGNTPEMMTYFSDLLGVKYPWPKYSQVVVRDFVSGAMENTTASVYYEGLNSTSQELIDRNHDGIIAHELIHHWFGDLVTCESWANIPLNEAFASYGEVLWREHKYGLDAADHSRMNDNRSYLMMAQQEKVPMIRFYHGAPSDVFDVNSYQRGSSTLAMLREYVGDDAFFESLNRYLSENQYQSVEIHDLRLAFEEVTGEDLNWFFDQWFMTAGYPVVQMEVGKDSAGKNHEISISQEHAGNDALIYRLPLTVHLYREDRLSEQRIWLTTADSTYHFPSGYDLILPDPAGMLVGDVSKSYPKDFYKKILHREGRLHERMTALDSVAPYQEEDPEAYELVRSALEDPYSRMRANALQHWEPIAEDFPLIREMALRDEHPGVRAAAVNKIFSVGDTANYDIFYTAIEDSSLQVASAALFLINEINPEKALDYASRFEDSDNSNLLITLAEIYADEAGPEKLSFFTSAVRKDLGWARFIIMNRFAEFTGRLDDGPTIREAIGSMTDMAERGSQTEAYVAFRGLKRVRDHLQERTELINNEEVQAMLESISAELSDRVELIYESTDNEMIRSSGLD